jgi:hypothetical protein
MITDPCIGLFPETSLAPLVRLEHIAEDFPFPNSNIRLEANSKPANFSSVVFCLSYCDCIDRPSVEKLVKSLTAF